MKKITSLLFSMQTMGLLILAFAIAIGAATFIENDFGTMSAQAVVYRSWWFELLLAVLAVNLTGRIFIGKMYSRKKLTMFIFHVSFLIILLGAAITRFISYEGSMHIRQGETSNTILSDETFVDVFIADGDRSKTEEHKVLISILTPKAYGESVSLNGKSYRMRSVAYIPSAQEVLKKTEQGGKPYLSLVASAGMGRQNLLIPYGESRSYSGGMVHFGENPEAGSVNITFVNDSLFILADGPISTLSMLTQQRDTLATGGWYPFEQRMLYEHPRGSFVITEFTANGMVDYVPSTGKESYMDAMVVHVSNGSEEKQVVLRGGQGYTGLPNTFTLGGATLTMQYGSKHIALPFGIQLVEFQLEHYPGSMSPSSYASEVVLMDPREDLKMPYRIYMNHVLNYDGYRFFQSSYDQDELGTILSVNHDYWGTFFTYIGYFLMSLGMLLTLVNRNSRFALLGRIIRRLADDRKKVTAVLVTGMMVLSSLSLQAQQSGNLFPHNENPTTVDAAQAKAFGELLVQSRDGRIKPVNTLASEVLRKVSRKNSYGDQNADQVFLGMMSDPMLWQQVPMIKIGHPEVAEVLGITGKHASYLDFIDLQNGKYKLSEYVNEAYAKKPAARSKFDNEIMKVDERLNICFMVYAGDMLKILPDPFDADHPWYAPSDKLTDMPREDSLFVSGIVPTYMDALAEGDLKLAGELLQGISDYQERYGKAIITERTRLDAELWYNKMMIFDNLSHYYSMVGVIMLILLFVEMFRSGKILRGIIKGLVVLVVLGFVAQTFGLGLRWYISGHAPWSDGYESLIYIGWVVLLAGLLFSKGSKMTIAATTILGGIILMVAHLSWMDPEVTNLVPVLKSYWLTIHVSIITASYGFLALSMLLGFLNLLLMIFRTSKNVDVIGARIKELTAINERAVMVGLYMLTIGTFLGGVWANESWGRYWGWDPKETWALVSVLVYAFVAHMQYMPGMKSRFSFNFATLISYFSILMTYFGVNYYLSGLHSYAKGDPVPVPTFVYYTVAVIVLISLVAWIRERSLQEKR